MTWWSPALNHSTDSNTKASKTLRADTPSALVTAPFFVHIEMLFGLFGWNPALEKRIMNLSAKRIVAMNKAKRARGKKTE